MKIPSLEQYVAIFPKGTGTGPVPKSVRKIHEWAWVMAVSLNYCTALHLSLKFCNRFNRQKQENDKIKFWKSVSSYVLVRKYQLRNKIIFIPSNKWENLQNVLFYRQQIAYTSAPYCKSTNKYHEKSPFINEHHYSNNLLFSNQNVSVWGVVIAQ